MKGFDIAWLTKIAPEQAKEIFAGKTTMKDKNAGTGQEIKPNKYRNKKIETVDGVFDSTKEFNRWRELQTLWSAGEIENLERQVKFYFKCNTVLIEGKEIKLPYQLFRYYIADFVYIEKGKKVIEDAKGTRLNSFKRQKLLMKLVYNIEIKEV